MTEKIVNVGLIGYGFAGRAFHAPIITSVPGLRLKTVLQRSGDSCKERYPWVQVVKSMDELLADDELDLIVVTTPNEQHVPMTEQALKAGKHVVVEKPFTIHSEDGTRLIELAKQRNLTLSVYHNRRFDGDFLTVRGVVEQGLLGDVVDYEAHWERYHSTPNPTRWRETEEPGTGILYDLGSHLIDQAMQLFGYPETVTGTERIVREGGKAVDAFEVVLGYGAGKPRAILKGNMLVREQGPHFIVHGTQGSFVKYGMDPQEAALIHGDTPKSAGWGVDSEHLWGTLHTEIDGLVMRGTIETVRGSYESYYRNVYEAIALGKELAVKPEQANAVIRVIELAIESSREGRTMPFDASAFA